MASLSLSKRQINPNPKKYPVAANPVILFNIDDMAVIGKRYISKLGDNIFICYCFIILCYIQFKLNINYILIIFSIIMSILSPDKNTRFLHGYHYTNKLLIPLFLTSYAITGKSISYIVDSYAAFVIGYHSYFSISTVITDYLPKITHSAFANKVVRFSNLNIHILSLIGIQGYLVRSSKLN